MTLIGIIHAVGTAVSQVVATTAAHGVSAATAGHYANIVGALGGWVLAGITTPVLVGVSVVAVGGEEHENCTFNIFDKIKKYYKYK
ncbi:hypothetical protein PIROE2DRAFT_5108 [Piromyces sp. E2]|nr:hypothetical protein PIROE2DRAFT_5108 [Piromyces sp. E2]|eukprot:OUM67469.1 hypothetical protein PIROE2DRAFT_5108 [Piromyces sp. E2]